MDKNLKNGFILITFGVCLYAALNNLNVFLDFIGSFNNMISPIVVGAILAFVLNVPMKGIEKLLDKKLKREKSNRGLALFLTILLLLVVIVIVGWVLIPELVSSITQAVKSVQRSIPDIITFLDKYGISAAWLKDINLTKIDVDLLKKITTGMGSAGSSLIGGVSSAAGNLVKTIMAIVFAIYFLIDKEMLCDHISIIYKKLLPEKIYKNLAKTLIMLNTTFGSFLTGQCKESILLGIMMLVAFTIIRLPYAGLTAILTAVTAMIPYVGAFISCAIAVFLTLLIDPFKALVAFIVYQTVQFIENQFVYPKVVGEAVGLPAIYTILAVFIGGALFGVIGMIFFIPLVATLYNLLTQDK